MTESALDDRAPAAGDARADDVTAVYAAHGDFVWSTLQRLGVRGDDLDDLLQEVFVVVHQRIHTFDGRGPMAAWLFGISLRVAAAHRRRAYGRRERAWENPPEREAPAGASPEVAAAASQARARLVAVLDGMDIEKRAVFVMYEVDEVPADEIAAMLGIPFNTVHSRLRAARKQFDQVLGRLRARDARRGTP